MFGTMKEKGQSNENIYSLKSQKMNIPLKTSKTLDNKNNDHLKIKTNESLMLKRFENFDRNI